MLNNAMEKNLLINAKIESVISGSESENESYFVEDIEEMCA
jgi:hypothetical protein